MKTYDDISKLVNDTYKDNPDIRTVTKDLELSVDVVWECLGFKDCLDFKETEWKDSQGYWFQDGVYGRLSVTL